MVALDANIGMGASYLWSDNSEASIYNFDGNIGEGAYNVWVQVTDINGCSTSDDIDITVDFYLGQSEYDSKSIELYPNPTHEYVKIKLPNDKNYAFSISDINGKEVEIGFLSSKMNSIRLNNLSKGTYFFKIEELDLVKKLIIY